MKILAETWRLILTGGCVILLIIKWVVVIPVWSLTFHLITGRFFNEFDFATLPEEWFFNLTHHKEHHHEI
jgi:hypothetical protein